MTPVFILGIALLIIGAIAVAFPARKTYLTRLINLEIAGFGLLFVMLEYDETLALITFLTVSAVSTFIFVRILEKKEANRDCGAACDAESDAFAERRGCN